VIYDVPCEELSNIYPKKNWVFFKAFVQYYNNIQFCSGHTLLACSTSAIKWDRPRSINYDQDLAYCLICFTSNKFYNVYKTAI
jgi:hypothetical protein